MAAITQPNSISGNGAATPATATLTGVTAGDFLVCVITCVGSTATSIAVPTGDSWSNVLNIAGSGSGVPSLAMFRLSNAGAGSHTPSSVLTGTITGWICQVFEFNMQGTATIFASNSSSQATAQLSNVFSTSSGQTVPTLVFFYAVTRTGNTTISSPTSGLNNYAPPGYTGSSQWSPSVLPQANIQGLSLDFYWGTNNDAWPCPFPTGAGLLSAAVNSAQIGASFISGDSFPETLKATNIAGLGGNNIPPFFQGMIGG